MLKGPYIVSFEDCHYAQVCRSSTIFGVMYIEKHIYVLTGMISCQAGEDEAFC